MRRLGTVLAVAGSVFACSGLAWPGVSHAAPEERPALVPAREASVLYRLTRPGTPATEVRVTTRPGGSSLRIDMADRTYMLLDQAGRRMSMVVPDEETVLELPYMVDAAGPFRLDERMRFTRRAGDTVAGVRCTVWDVVLEKARGTVCISDDGVLLRSTGTDETGRRTLVEALSVSYAPAPPGEFDPPPGYERIVPAPNGRAAAAPR